MHIQKQSQQITDLNGSASANKTITVQRSLAIGEINDPFEHEAEAVADRVMQKPLPQMSAGMGGAIQRKCAHCQEEEKAQMKPLSPFIQKKGNEGSTMASDAISAKIASTKGSGSIMDNGTKSFMESRFGADFGKTRIHTGSDSIQMNRELGAKAFTVANDIYFNDGEYQPETATGKHLLAHELTHTVQQQAATILPYRSKKAFNFGLKDDETLIEDSFNMAKDKGKKPWIELITVNLTTQKKDVNGFDTWVGDVVAQYYANAVKLPDLTFSVMAGSGDLGMTTPGNYKVTRIEGIGYNSGKYSGVVDKTTREGPNKRYSKDLNGNMSYAVFFHGGEALHSGPVDFSSHGCVHVDWTNDVTMKHLNYHSVIGSTKVIVKYP